MAIVGRHAETCLDLKLQKQRRTFLSGGCGWTTTADSDYDIGSDSDFLYNYYLEDKTEELPKVFLSKVPTLQSENPSNGSARENQNSCPVSDGASTMLTCPNCLHAFGHTSSPASTHSVSPSQQTSISQNIASSTCQPHIACTSAPMLLAPSLQRHPSAHTTCTVSRSSSAPAGGRCSVYITRDPDEEDEAPSADKFLPQQPSPSVPISFVLPSVPSFTATTAVPSSNLWTVTTASSNANPSQAPFLAAIVPWATLPPPTPSHEASAWPWIASPAIVVPTALLVPPPTVPSPANAPIPSSHVPSPTPPAAPSPETDLARLANTVRALRASCWYYEGLSWQGSATVLQDSAPGTFLVRDSSDSRFLYALSVQTERGPTSVRLHYSGGRFRLDAEPRLAAMMPLFDGVVRLVEHYLNEGKRGVKAAGQSSSSSPAKQPVGNQVWVDSRGRVCANVMLSRPRYRSPPSLQHFARLAFNKRLVASGKDAKGAAASLKLPTPILDYLLEYPHTL